MNIFLDRHLDAAKTTEFRVYWRVHNVDNYFASRDPVDGAEMTVLLI